MTKKDIIEGRSKIAAQTPTDSAMNYYSPRYRQWSR